MIFVAVTSIATFAAVAVAVTGADLRCFERLRTSNVLLWKRLVWVCRLNGVLSAAFASIAIIGCLANLVGEANPKAIPVLGFFAGWLYISVRYARWGWSIPLVHAGRLRRPRG